MGFHLTLQEAVVGSTYPQIAWLYFITGPLFFGVGWFQRTPMFARIQTLVPCRFHFEWLNILNQHLIVRNVILLYCYTVWSCTVWESTVMDLLNIYNVVCKSSRLLRFFFTIHRVYMYIYICLYRYLLFRHHRLMSETVVTHWHILNYE